MPDGCVNQPEPLLGGLRLQLTIPFYIFIIKAMRVSKGCSKIDPLLI